MRKPARRGSAAAVMMLVSPISPTLVTAVRVLFFFLLSILLLGANQSVAEPQVTERAVKVQAGKETRIAMFFSVRSDCTTGPLPTIKLQLAPTRGKVSIKNAKVRATNVKNCLAIEVPAYVAFYRAEADFSGTEVVELEITEAGGIKKVQRLTISVGKSNTGENI